MFPTRHPRTPATRPIIKTNMHKLVLHISWPCIVSTSIVFGKSIIWPKETEKISSFVGKVSSFFVSFFSSQRLYMIVKSMNHSFPFRCLHNKRFMFSLGMSQKMFQFPFNVFFLPCFLLGATRWITMLC